MRLEKKKRNMLERLITKLTVFCLRRKTLSGEQKASVLSALLNNLGALPIQDIISVDAVGAIKIYGKNLEPEQFISFREGVIALKESPARKLINDQIKFLAINLGIHNGLNTETIVFSKAALWLIQEEEKLLSTFSMER
jgi:hypothetical protein